MKELIFVLCFIVAISCTYGATKFHKSERPKRQTLPLVFTNGGTFKYIVGFGMPISNPDNATLGFAVAFQFLFDELSNISLVSPYFYYPTVASRQERDLDIERKLIDYGRRERMAFYKSLENSLNRFGLNGPDCLKRMICELQQHPVDHDGLIGEIIQVLFTPVYGYLRNLDLEFLDPDYQEYLDAQNFGEQMLSCPHVYTQCPEGSGLLEYLTVFLDNT